ncbi:hypothetical protein [Mycolicibacterium mageritense]|uniref:hypothetical protein n=1 Tax=Mycolicibacterium mageritense TaxID=53462 RepID=UPI00103BB20F
MPVVAVLDGAVAVGGVGMGETFADTGGTFADIGTVTGTVVGGVRGGVSGTLTREAGGSTD